MRNMKAANGYILASTIIFALTIIVLMPPVFAQSQALNGQIEVTVTDQTGAPGHGAAITATNIESGVKSSALTDKSGVFRFPLLPFGAYRLSAEVARFKKFVRERISLATGQTVSARILSVFSIKSQPKADFH